MAANLAYSPPLEKVIPYELTTTLTVISFILTLLFSLKAGRSTHSNGTKWVRKMDSMEKVESGSLVLTMGFVLLQCSVTIWKAVKAYHGIEASVTSQDSVAIDVPTLESNIHVLLTVVPLVTMYLVKLLYLTYFFSTKVFPYLMTPCRLFLYLVSTIWACSFICSVLLVVLWCHPFYAGTNINVNGSMEKRHLIQMGCWVGVDFQAGTVVALVDLIGGILIAVFGLLVLHLVPSIRSHREEPPLEPRMRRILIGLLMLGFMSIVACAGRLGVTIEMLRRTLQGEEDVSEIMLLWVQIFGRLEIVFGVLSYGFRFGRRGEKAVEEVCSILGEYKRGSDGEAAGVRRSIEVATGRCFDYVKGELVEYRENLETGGIGKEIELILPGRNIGG